MLVESYDIMRGYPLIDKYSVCNAIVFSSIFALFFYFLCRKTSWMVRLGLRPLLVFLFLAVVRLLLPLEFPFSRIVGSQTILPGIRRFFRISLFRMGGHEIQIGYLLVAIWVAGTLFLIGRSIWQWIHYTRRISKCLEAPAEMMEDIRKWIPEFRGKVCITEEDEVPYVNGFFRPVIFLPAVDYTVEDLRLICLHEWQHFHNRDQWSKLLCHLFCCFFWWNPLMWLLKRQMDRLLELRCDFSVLKKLTKAEQVSYYAMLLNIYQSMMCKESTIPEEVPALAGARHHDIVLQRFQMGRSFSAMEKQRKTLGVIFSIMLIAAFCFSYGVIVQPRELPKVVGIEKGAKKEKNSYYIEFPEGSYLTPNEDGSYTVHCDGNDIVVQDITVEPFVSLPIVK